MILRDLLFLLPPEVAHSLAIMALKKIPYKNPIELPESLSVNFLVISSEAPWVWLQVLTRMQKL